MMGKGVVIQSARILRNEICIRSRWQSPPLFRSELIICRHATSIHKPAGWRSSDWTEVIRPMATWITNDATRFDTKQFLNQLPRMNQFDGYDSHYKSILFMVTPQLAHLFESGSNLHAEAFNTIFPADVTKNTGKRSSTVAVVDAFPALGPESGDRKEKAEVHGYEGIGVCVADHFDVVETDNGGEISQQPAILISSNLRGKDNFIKFGVAPANTLFLNGYPWTMYSQSWDPADGRYIVSPQSQKTLSSLTLSAHVSLQKSRPIHGIMKAGLRKLTEPALIENSMGNVIREIRLSDTSAVVSASHELETLVPARLKEMQKYNPRGEIRVYAYCSVKPRNGPAKQSATDARHSEGTGFDQKLYFRLLFNSGRLFRVNGGGAGWGQKAGLISVDPETELYELVSDSSSQAIDLDAITSFSDLSKKDELFKPHEHVQFYYSFHDPEGEIKHGYKIQHSKAPIFRREDYFSGDSTQNLHIGGSYQPSTTHIMSNGKQGSGEHIQIFSPQNLGVLSTSRLNVWLKGKQNSHSTLIDVPNSCITLEGLAGGQARTRQLDMIPDLPPELQLLRHKSYRIHSEYATSDTSDPQLDVMTLVRLLGFPDEVKMLHGVGQPRMAQQWFDERVQKHKLRAADLPNQIRRHVRQLIPGKGVVLHSAIAEDKWPIKQRPRVVLERLDSNGAFQLYYLKKKFLGVTYVQQKLDIIYVEAKDNLVRHINEGNLRVAANNQITRRDLKSVRHERGKAYRTTESFTDVPMPNRDYTQMRHELKKAILGSYNQLTAADKHEFKIAMIRKYSGSYATVGANQDFQPRFSVAGDRPFDWMYFGDGEELVSLPERLEAEKALIDELVDDIFEEEEQKSGNIVEGEEQPGRTRASKSDDPVY